MKTNIKSNISHARDQILQRIIQQTENKNKQKIYFNKISLIYFQKKLHLS